MINYTPWDNADIGNAWKQLHGFALLADGCSLVKKDICTWSEQNDWDMNGKNHSGLVYLKVTNGYLRNREISSENKRLFNDELFPRLKYFDPSCKNGFSGLIECSLRTNDLLGMNAISNN